MNRLVALILILFSSLAMAGTSGSFDDDGSEAPAPAAKPAEPALKPAASKPAPVRSNDEDDNDDEEVPVTKPAARRDDGLLSPARAAARQRSTSEDRDAEGSYGKCRNCSQKSEPTPRLPVRHITGPAEVLHSRIWSQFARNFEACAPGCQPIGMGSYRDPHMRPKPSCHHISAAIDVAGMRCGSTVYMSSDESIASRAAKFGRRAGEGRFSDMVRCMRRGPDGLRTMYMEADHYDHAHFSNGCVLPGGIRMIK